MRRREVFAFLALVSSAAIGACSLFVDTSGLSGNAAETAAETGTAPESGATDGPAIEGAAADAANDSAAFACDGGTTITSFDGFDTSGTVTIQDSTLTASATSTAKDENIEAVGRRNFPSAPSRVALSYDLVLTRNDIMYFEPGCGVNLADSQGGSIFRQTLAANHEAFSQYLNVDLPDGGSDDRQFAFADLPTGATSRHIDLVLTRSGTSLAVDLQVDSASQHDVRILRAVPLQLYLRCGIAFGAQTSPGSATTSVTLRNLAISLCP